MSIEITQAEWLAELERIWNNHQSDEGLTIKEYQELLGWPSARTQDTVRAAVRAGTMVIGRRRVEKDWDGRSRIYTVYRPAGAP